MYTQPPESSGCRTPIVVFWQGVSYTIKAWESFHRDQGLPFFGEEVPSRRTLSMSYLVRACAVATGFHTKFELMNGHILNLLKVLFSHDFECILDLDAVSLLIALVYSMPYLYQDSEESLLPPMGTFRDKYLLELVLVLHITQVLVTGDFDEFLTESQHNIDPDDPSFLVFEDATSPHIYQVWGGAGRPRKSIFDITGLWNKIGLAVNPFLRCAAKFFESLTGISPTMTGEIVGENLAFLGLGNLRGIYEKELYGPYIKSWVSHPRVKIVLENTRLFNEKKLLPSSIAVKYPVGSSKLFDLPPDYSELINSVSLFACQNGSIYDTHDSRTPTLCLLCGKILCSQSYCCQGDLFGEQVGACNFHSYYCGGGCGVFLRIRECKVFFLSGRNKGCFMPPPYLDEYGETDQGLRRGNPMSLSRDKYESFRRYWLMHQIPEEIARITEHSTSIIATDWQYL